MVMRHQNLKFDLEHWGGGQRRTASIYHHKEYKFSVISRIQLGALLHLGLPHTKRRHLMDLIMLTSHITFWLKKQMRINILPKDKTCWL